MYRDSTVEEEDEDEEEKMKEKQQAALVVITEQASRHLKPAGVNSRSLFIPCY